MRALDGLDLRVARGTVCAVLGPNGAGKTAATRVLATLTLSDAGRASVLGHDVVRDARAVRRSIGPAGQHAAVDATSAAARAWRFSAGCTTSADAVRASARGSCSTGSTSPTPPTRLVRTWSGGMRRRLDLIASVVARPVLFLDEPTTGLDPRSRTEIWSTVRERLVAAGTTVLLTTQYLEEADRLADDIVIVDAGRAVATGTPDTLKAAMWCAGRGGRRGAGGPRFCRGGA